MTSKHLKISSLICMSFMFNYGYANPTNVVEEITSETNFTIHTVAPSTLNIGGESTTVNTFQIGQISLDPIFSTTPLAPGPLTTTPINGILSTSINPSIFAGTLQYQGPLLMGQIAAGPSFVGNLLGGNSTYSISGQIQTSDLILNGVVGLGGPSQISYGYQALTSNAWQVGVGNFSGSNTALTVIPGTVAISGANLNMNNNRINGVAPGIAGTDAVNLNQLEHVSKKSYQGISSVAAMSGIPALPSDKQYNLGVGVGNYAGENSLAIGGNVRFNENVYGKVGVGMSGSNSAASAGIGVAF